MHEYIISTSGRGMVPTSTDGNPIPFDVSFRPEFGWSFDIAKPSFIIVASFTFLENILRVTRFNVDESQTGLTIAQAAYDVFDYPMVRRGDEYKYVRENYNMIIQLTDL